MTNLSSVDWNEFDTDCKLYSDIAANLKIHDRPGRDTRKHWYMPRWVATNDILVVYGPSEAGKSVFAVDMACRLAAGMGFEGEVLPHRRNVLYVAAERAGQVERRIDAFVKHHDGEAFDNILIYDGPIDLAEPYALRAIVRTANLVLDDTIEVVVIDTLSAAMSASDSSPDGMAKAVHNLTDTARCGNLYEGDQFGCTVVAIHHTPVSGATRLRGGGQLQAAADMTILVTRKRDVSTAQVMKNNESADRPCRTYRMETVTLSEHDGVATTAPVLVECATPSATKPQQKASRLVCDATAVLRAAIAANDNQPVSEDQWRAAVYQAAGDITPGGKRLKFSKHKRALMDEHITEVDGKFDLNSSATVAQQTATVVALPLRATP
ncbi:AAA family ATPase [Hoeflea sp.]|uniref:AAA family ATPase n=1 Tax=Hoeflea sp. TaxID=1940281 RepID=UPI003A90394D